MLTKWDGRNNTLWKFILHKNLWVLVKMENYTQETTLQLRNPKDATRKVHLRSYKIGIWIWDLKVIPVQRLPPAPCICSATLISPPAVGSHARASPRAVHSHEHLACPGSVTPLTSSDQPVGKNRRNIVEEIHSWGLTCKQRMLRCKRPTFSFSLNTSWFHKITFPQ